MKDKLIRKDNSFDFIRLFAAMSVVVIHANRHLEISFFGMSNGNMFLFSDGVPLFFILSGYLVYSSYIKCMEQYNSSIQYFRNRFLRIAPAIYFYMIISVIFLLSIGYLSIDNMRHIQFIGWSISNLILIPVYHPELLRDFGIGVFNGSLWTIPAELSFYCFVPVIYYFEKKLGDKKTIILLLGLSLLGTALRQYLFSINNAENIVVKLLDITFIPYFTFFALGIILLRIWNRIPKKTWIFLICVLLYLILGSVNTIPEFLRDLTRGIPLSYSAIWFGYHSPLLLKKTTKVIGDLSYGVYIWHMVIVNVFIYFGIKDFITNGTAINCIVIAATSLIAFISWHMVEKQMLKLKHYSINK